MNSSQSPAGAPPRPPVLKILRGSHKGKQFRLMGERIIFGRHSDCDVILKDNKGCSLRHACIRRADGGHTIQTLDSANPVLVNKQAVSLHTLSSGDKITIGNMIFQFREKAPVPSAPAPDRFHPGKKQKKPSSPSRIILIGLFALMAGLFLLPEEKEEETEKPIDVRTEKEIENEVEALKEMTTEETETANLPPEELEARVAFIRGFRDYRKGYYSRALKSFKHCVTLNKAYGICRSYVRQAQTQVNRIIQKKMLLGKNYQQNKQYDACKAAFLSVEIMIQNASSPVYKEARENRKLCELKTKNRL